MEYPEKQHQRTAEDHRAVIMYVGQGHIDFRKSFQLDSMKNSEI